LFRDILRRERAGLKVKKRVFIALVIVLVCLVVWRLVAVPGTYHFSGEGKNFGAGVNTTFGLTSFKDLELVVYSKHSKDIKNIEYDLKGRFGLKALGVISLDDKGYYIGSLVDGNSTNSISKFDAVTLTLKWQGQSEEITLRNTD
jgi:hypothetical protein